MIPVLYAKDEYQFTTNGIGSLSDVLSCKVSEERNGAYELTMEYPENGIHASEIETDMFIWAKPSAFSSPQPFRITKINKALNKKFKINAQHISYDLAYTSVMPCSGFNASNALANMAANSINIGRFTTWSDVSTSAAFAVTEPASFRNIMGGMSGSILDVYGGEIEWDVFAVKLHAARGRDRGLTLRYGKNITDIEQEKDIDYTITGITPYLVDNEKKTLTLPEKTIWKEGVSYEPKRDKALNMQSYVDERQIREDNPDAEESQIEAKLIEEMRKQAKAYVERNITGVPDAAIEVSFVNLGDTEEYKDWKSLFTQAALCDTVSVYYERLGIATTAKIVKTEYNVLLERFEKLTIGKSRTNLVSNIANLSKDIKAAEERANAKTTALGGTLNVALEDLGDEINKTAENLAAAIANASNLITGQQGGYVVIDRDANGYPYEILIMDTPNKATATKVWRWNAAGLGYSSNGYNGTYATAITKDGAIVADFITTGSLSASLITAGVLNASLITTGVLRDKAGRNWWNMSNGEFSFANGNMLYELADESFIQLKNNLSLRLNGIPLCGKEFQLIITTDDNGTYKDREGVIIVPTMSPMKIQMGGMNVLYSSFNDCHLNLSRLRFIHYPYMLHIHAEIQIIKKVSYARTGFTIYGGPVIATQEYSWMGDTIYFPTYLVTWDGGGGYKATLGDYVCQCRMVTNSVSTIDYFSESKIPAYEFIFAGAKPGTYIINVTIPTVPEIIETE